MRKQALKTGLIVLLLTIMVPHVNAEISPAKGYYATYEIVLTDIIRNGGADLHRLADNDRRIYLPLNTSWQTVYIVESSYPVQNKTYDSDGNRIAYLDVMPLYLRSNELVVVNVTYHTNVYAKEIPQLDETLSGSLSEIPQELKRDYCQPIGPWQFNRTSWKYLSTIANATVKNEGTVLRILYNFVNWIGKNVGSPSKEHFRPLYPNETYGQQNFEQGKRGEGDCDDQANLLITFCRIVGIPAYLQIGCIYLPTEQYDSKKDSGLYEGHLSIEERHIGFHGWAMVYVPPWGWIPIDMTWGYDQSKGPSSATTKSAIMTVNAIAMLNVIKTDYVLEDEEWSKNLVDSNLYVAEIYSMSLLVKPEYDQIPLGGLLPSGFGIILVTIVVLSLYVVAKRRKLRYNQTGLQGLASTLSRKDSLGLRLRRP